jgi:large repetitive protein
MKTCAPGSCGWSTTKNFYGCDTDGGSDPSGQFPKECGQGSGGTGGTGGTGGSSGSGGSGGGLMAPPFYPPAEPDVVTCPKALAPAVDGVCDVVAGSGVKVVQGRVIAPDHVYEGGEVVIDAAGKIACVGCDCSQTEGYQGATTVTCAKGVVSPALINTHDHITFAQNAPKPHPGVKYDHRHEWRKGLNGKPKVSVPSGSPTNAVVQWGELRFVLGGAASTVGSGGVDGMLRNLDRSGTQQGGLGLAKPVDFETFPLDDSGGAMLTQCTYSSKAVADSVVQADDAFLPHVAEGIGDAAHNELACSNGEPGSQRDYAEPQTAMIHAVGLTAKDADLLAHTGTAVIWSPRSNLDLYGFTAPVSLFAAAGVQLALGTDWSASGSMNLLRELACADSYNKANLGGFFSDYRLYRMVTEDAASVTATADKLGALKVGLFADVTVWDDGGKTSVYDVVVRAKVQDVALVLRAGQALYGESELVDAVASDKGAGCEAIDVCGAPARKVCSQREFGSSTAAIKASITGELYPLFFCDAPDLEPSCVPSRANEFTGVPTDTDKDGDGIPDATDLCPTVFSAMRPMDKGAQPDSDSDGLGDVCDPCPLDPAAGCVQP